MPPSALRRVCALCRFPPIPHNCRVNIAFNIVSSAASSLTTGAFWSNFLVALPAQNDETVGYVYAVAGVTMVVLALPLGLLTDRISRSLVLRGSAVVGLASAGLLFAALLTHSVPLIYTASAFSGAFSAASGPALAASFADALPTGERTALMSLQYSTGLTASALGPALAAIAFSVLGDAWDLDTLAHVMMGGNILSALSCGLLFLIYDTMAPGNECKVDSDGGGSLNSDAGAEALGVALLMEVEEGEGSVAQPTEGSGIRRICGLTPAAIPWLIFVADFIIACGAGMSIAFFPLFFSSTGEGDGLGLSPVAVALVFALSPLLIAIAGIAALPLARALGRAGAAVALDATGAVCILVLCLPRLPPLLAVAVYLLRTAAMNAGYPLTRAILMDSISSTNRGKWSSLAGLTAFTWTGSAALGGYLVTELSFRETFFITGCIYFVGCIPLALVIPLTWGEKVDKGVDVGGQGSPVGEAAPEE